MKAPLRAAAKKLKKIVITGGPSGGKTTLIETLQKEFPREVAVVTEAASVLYRGGFPRIASSRARVHAQRAIYFVQSELENLAQGQARKGTFLICDRGSVDGAAYWPGGMSSFFRSLGTSLNDELSRYDWVLHLDTTRSASYGTNNPVRTENHEQAIKLNQKIKKAWARHPRRLVLPHQEQFSQKTQLAIEIVRLIFSDASYDLVADFLNSKL